MKLYEKVEGKLKEDSSFKINKGNISAKLNEGVTDESLKQANKNWADAAVNALGDNQSPSRAQLMDKLIENPKQFKAFMDAVGIQPTRSSDEQKSANFLKLYEKVEGKLKEDPSFLINKENIVALIAAPAIDPQVLEAAREIGKSVAGSIQPAPPDVGNKCSSNTEGMEVPPMVRTKSYQK